MIFINSSDLDKELAKMKDLLENIVNKMNDELTGNKTFETLGSQNDLKSSDRSSVIYLKFLLINFLIK